jgi:hypothetical protein
MLPESGAIRVGAKLRSRKAVDPVFIQKAVFVISAALLAWSVAGLIANPSFETGAGATSPRVLGVEFNGWHAISGFLLFGPGLLSALRRDWAQLFAVAAALLLVISGILVARARVGGEDIELVEHKRLDQEGKIRELTARSKMTHSKEPAPRSRSSPRSTFDPISPRTPAGHS